MKIHEIKPYKYTIFIDLDGVIVDFDKFCEQHIGIRPKDTDADKATKREFWKRVKTWVNDGNAFFSAMEPLPDASVLLAYIKKYNPIVLSATGSATKNAAGEKRDWVKTHIGGAAAKRAILVMSAADKAQYATPTHILIDDRSAAIDPWIAAGGIGILHTSAATTIKKLRDLGL